LDAIGIAGTYLKGSRNQLLQERPIFAICSSIGTLSVRFHQLRDSPWH
jgi:hypothetical protein